MVLHLGMRYMKYLLTDIRDFLESFMKLGGRVFRGCYVKPLRRFGSLVSAGV